MTQARAVRFKQSDVTRAINGCKKAGVRVGRVEIDANGKIVILSESVAPAAAANSWDDV